MQACSFDSPTPDETRALAEILGGVIEAETPSEEAVVVLLGGPLGAGKTLFVQGLAGGLGVDPAQVASPTFALAAEHRGASRRVVHVDCYRLADADELESMGVGDWLAPGCVLAVEWGDRFPAAFPTDRLEIALARVGEVGQDSAAASPRRIDARAGGSAAAALLAHWAAAIRTAR